MKFAPIKRQFIQFIRRQNIARKIALGYGVTIGIAVLGASFGMVAGSIYESRAARHRDIAVQKAQLVARLESDTFLLALHPQHLLESANQSNWLEDEIAQFSRDVAALRAASRTFEDFLITRNELQKTEGLAVAQSLRIFLDDYELWIESLWLALRSSAQETEIGPFASQLREARVAIFAAELNKPRAEELQVQLKQLSEQLGQLEMSAKVLETQAISQLQAARNLRFWVVVISLMTSMAFAIALR